MILEDIFTLQGRNEKSNNVIHRFGNLSISFLIPLLQKRPNDISQEQNVYIENALSILSQEEKKDLESMFEHFFFFDGFAYSLFGTKPMSIARLLPTPEMKMGWDAWRKIAPSFNV